MHKMIVKNTRKVKSYWKEPIWTKSNGNENIYKYIKLWNPYLF